MRLSVTRNFKINLGNYESYQFSATATVDHGDLGYTDQEMQEKAAEGGDAFRKQLSEEIRDELERLLELLIKEDIETSAEITEEQRSVVLRAFIHSQPTNRPETPPPAANRRRVTRHGRDKGSSTSRTSASR